jgi:hypothetical protein
VNILQRCKATSARLSTKELLLSVVQVGLIAVIFALAGGVTGMPSFLEVLHFQQLNVLHALLPLLLASDHSSASRNCTLNVEILCCNLKSAMLSKIRRKSVSQIASALQKFYPQVIAAKNSAAANDHNKYCTFDDQQLQLWTSSMFLAGAVAGWFHCMFNLLLHVDALNVAQSLPLLLVSIAMLLRI